MFYQFIKEGWEVTNEQYNVIVGCYGADNEETIHQFTFDGKAGTLQKRRAFNGITNPSFLTVNVTHDRLYAVSEVEVGEVASYTLDMSAANISPLNRQKTKGGPCFVTVDSSNQYVLTANYSGGSIIVHQVEDDGSLGKETAFLEYNQEKPGNIHAIKEMPIKHHYIATDLGNNAFYLFELDTNDGKLHTLQEVTVPHGSGPRHVTFHPTLPLLYIVNEFNSKVLVYAYDMETKEITLVQEEPTLLEPFHEDNYGADVHITSNGEFLYTSNRGHHSLTAYEVNKEGQLTPLTNIDIAGEWPRNFAISPNDAFVLVANEHTNELVVFKVEKDGTLIETGETYAVERPVCIQFC